MKHFKLFLLLIFCTQGTLGQNPKISFQHLTVEDGLSQNGVMSIYRDKQGFMWFGTRDGLNRYDGYDFHVYRNLPYDTLSISNNFIHTIQQDHRGNLWIGTNRGASKFDVKLQTFRQYFFRPIENRNFSTNAVHSILAQKDGTVWFGTSSGLFSYHADIDKMVPYYFTDRGRHEKEVEVRALSLDDQGKLWIGTTYSGLFMVDPKKNETRHYQNIPTDKASLADDYIHCITTDGRGNLWIGHDTGGLSYFDIEQKEFTNYQFDVADNNSLSNNRVRAISIDVNGNLWIGTYEGLNYFDLSRQKFIRYFHSGNRVNSLSNNSIRSIYIDENKVIWIGSYFGGVNIIDPHYKNFIHYKNNDLDEKSLSFDVVGPFEEDNKGNVWVGTEGGGLNYFNREDNTFIKYKPNPNRSDWISSHTIKSLVLDHQGGVWIGTHQKGLDFLDAEKQKFKNFNSKSDMPINANNVEALFEDSRHNLWIGSNGGVNVLNKDRTEMEAFGVSGDARHSLTDERIKSFFEDRSGNVWVGTNGGGINVFNSDKRIIKRYLHNPGDSTSLSSNRVLCFLEDKKGMIWMGTYGGGLNVFDPNTETFESFRVEDGLINDIVYGVLQDDVGFLWISTPEGLSKFDPIHRVFTNFGRDEGLPVTEFNIYSYMQTREGEMFFGGLNGFMILRPNRIDINRSIPPVVITGLKLFNKEVGIREPDGILKEHISKTDQLIFNYDQSNFTLEFVSLNYTVPSKNQYAYKLEGFDKGWSFVGTQRWATYTNINPGKYVFKVKASNNDGVWNEEGRAVEIIMLPPPWKTWWAFLIYFLMVAGALITIRHFLIFKLRLEHKLELERLSKEKIQELTKMKLRFFTNISHEFRTPLSLIHGPVEEMLSSEDLSKSVSQNLKLVKRNVRHLLRLVNQLMDFRKLENDKLDLSVLEGNIVAYIQEIISSFSGHAKLKKISLELVCHEDSIVLFFDRDKIEKILCNLLSNAFKFCSERGEIRVEISKNVIEKPDEMASLVAEEYVEIKVKDTGKGISQDQLKSIFEPFYQVKNSNNVNPGTGIGLAVTKGLVKLHKGYINIASQLGVGTEIVIGLPMDGSIYSTHEKGGVKDAQFEFKEELIGMEEDLEELHETVDRNKDENFTILIIEDNDDLRSFLKTSLSKNFSVREASNGETGVQEALKSPPNLIISDVMMPVMDGVQVCKTLKKDPKTKHIPIILLTAKSTFAQKIRGLRYGADDYITKPFSITELNIRIANLMQSQESIKKRLHKEEFLTDENLDKSSADEQLLDKLVQLVKERMADENISVSVLGEELGMSRVHLYRKIKQLTGASPVELIRKIRLNAAALLLKQNNYNINEICYKTGFQDSGYFRKCFKKQFGVSPSEYLNHESGVEKGNFRSIEVLSAYEK
ncbi:MAG: two-component regulator propeller domain-containing protein [Cyclobacteriaceae bacterium]